VPIGATKVQSVNAVTAVTTSVSASWPAPTTAGNLLVAVVGLSLVSNPSPPTISPPSGWTTATGAVAESAANCRTHLFYIAGSASRSGSETFDWSGALDIDDSVLVLVEWSGLATTSPLDRTANTNGTSVALAVLSGTTSATTEADELVIAAIANRNVSTQGSPSNGFAQVEQAQSTNGTTSNRVNFAVYSKVVSATGAQSMQATLSGSTQRPYAGVVATFKAPAAPAGSWTYGHDVRIGG